MGIIITRGTSQKPVTSERLAQFFAHSEFNGFFYTGFPTIGTPEGKFPIDAVWMSAEKGLVVFHLVEGKEVGDIRDIQDEIYNKLEARLRLHKTLVKGRILNTPPQIVTFAPMFKSQEIDKDYPICNANNLENFLNFIDCSLNQETFKALVAAIQAVSTIRSDRKKRILQKQDSRGAKLKRLEESIANLDEQQNRAIIESIDGVQRIRGLAGSGKTIVLALKAAYLHANQPDWKIAVTFNTRSLKEQFRRLIEVFVIEQTNEIPNWENLSILQAWGAPGHGDSEGVYFNFCTANGLEYFDFDMAKRKFGKDHTFEGVCQHALAQLGKPSIQFYDALLVDEAQDFSPDFLKLCYEMLSEKKRLIYAYDELQNLNSKPLPPPDEIFGKDIHGNPLVSFVDQKGEKPEQDIILKKCYRNSRPILATAHALGFGIYRAPSLNTKSGLIQMFSHNKLWEDVGYKVKSGDLSDGKKVVLRRTEESSPKFLEEHSTKEDLIQFQRFSTVVEQAQWIANEITKNLSEDELRYDDIIVINPNPLSTREQVAPIRKILFEQGINSHLVGVDTSRDTFFTPENSITFTGIYRAKGNEAGMVYIINAQDCYYAYGKLSTVRNRLFTAITRSKAWVRVVGVGESMDKMIQEYEQVRQNNFELNFRLPEETEKAYLSIVNRDMTVDEIKSKQRNESGIDSLMEDIKSGKIQPEDLRNKIDQLNSLLEEYRVGA